MAAQRPNGADVESQYGVQPRDPRPQNIPRALKGRTGTCGVVKNNPVHHRTSAAPSRTASPPCTIHRRENQPPEQSPLSFLPSLPASGASCVHLFR